MTRFRATLAYNGSAYFGYQIQPDLPTVQGTLEDALMQIFKQPTRVDAAGRTDTGVHASGQVIAFDAEWKHGTRALLRAINAKLPDDIALQDITQQDKFHPRFDALSRTYRYHVAVVEVRQPLLHQRAWQVQHKLDISVMQRAAGCVIGEQDFAAFGKPPQGSNTVRALFRSVWHTEQHAHGEQFIYEVEATAFLHHMVRRLVGLQVALGAGWITFDEFQMIFASCDLSQNHHIAPPYGLTLTQVRYPPIGVSRANYQRTQGQAI
ncbi:MAG: tRNA pseudouridine(38-40) synthase TruA [Anaerolineae bacterium]